MPRADCTAVIHGARPKLALVALLTLAGCGAGVRQCLNTDATLSTRGVAVALPNGCRAVRTGPDGVFILACDDGRVGYAFNEPETVAQ
ncbi:hypothetical protein DQW77_10975 [Roseovarius sp. TE539]|uniref:hypothetical protein n=1 Tax=Roseovarius sp. TE539 TaxID=2249812 RepID=UPI000DDF46DD|nr:hypothetical protein [Roseovarius sp. TE539]RBI72277.1 hypothetical protein DQW77_10975 [Roseovarius sp. TE539]